MDVLYFLGEEEKRRKINAPEGLLYNETNIGRPPHSFLPLELCNYEPRRWVGETVFHSISAAFDVRHLQPKQLRDHPDHDH
jgi:hypothetical protein